MTLNRYERKTISGKIMKTICYTTKDKGKYLAISVTDSESSLSSVSVG